MAIYVDDMHRFAMGRYRGMKMSHMIADTDEELHAMADRIGVARRHHQGDHYDICLAKRSLAIAAGAIEVTTKQLACMVSLRKYGQPMGDPLTAQQRFVELRSKKSEG